MIRLLLAIALYGALTDNGCSQAPLAPLAERLLEAARLEPGTATANAEFGQALATHGEYLVVGAPDDDEDRGAAYVFLRSTLGWSSDPPIAKLTASDGQPFDGFGWSVAIRDDSIAVGARNARITRYKAGAVYVFEKPPSGWRDANESAVLTVGDRALGSGLGAQVVFDGDSIIASAPAWGAGPEGRFAEGAILVFERPAGGWRDASEDAVLTTAAGLAGTRLGSGSLAISGSTLVAGALPLGIFDQGAFLFERPAEGWVDMVETAQLKATDQIIATTVAVDGDTVVVADTDSGFPRPANIKVYVFEKPGAGWVDMTETAVLTPSATSRYARGFGQGLAIEGDTIAVGWPTGSPEAVYLYQKSGQRWVDATETKALQPSSTRRDEDFGASVKLRDGQLFVSAPGESSARQRPEAVYVFDAATTTVGCGLQAVGLTGTRRRIGTLNVGVSFANPAGFATGLAISPGAQPPLLLPAGLACGDGPGCLPYCPPTIFMVASSRRLSLWSLGPVGTPLCIQAFRIEDFCVRFTGITTVVISN